ncbi:aspartate aminotransferase family protein [Myceligenerans xiligouense]|uniref:Glutamate-1-semialdehyde 2,1-aminomutase n=1 Tax=Myceligenerans xiligouense TaxID=253184 RepID=A0A3N4Z8T0_9MICO|nr:aminotransferase class III-fold pyridoxal phosphate-dependent enzyme [Myceligenerans xiligouense]RPF22278.1 glutamate-1-semialdehyde 2,1-aminomutase [Myceligenerans xiligouense]
MTATLDTTSNLAYHDRVKQILPGGVHYNFNMPWAEVPIHFSGGRGSRLFDVDGNEYLDLYARFGAMILGHSNEEYIEALSAAMRDVLCVSHTDFDADVLELMNQHIPCAEMVRFGTSGSEILQIAIRLARGHTGRNKFVRFENHFHGSYDNIMGGRVPDRSNPVPVDYRGDYKGTVGRAENVMADQSYMLPWNDAEALEAFLAERGEEIACVLTEPVCVNGGSVEPAPGFLARVRELCTRYGVVLIFDEMITGVRMGLGGAQKEFGVTPDLATFGKAIAGGGVPIAALAGRREIMRLLESKRVIHAGTFNGYSLGAAGVRATFQILGRDDEAALTGMRRRVEAMHGILRDEAERVGLPLIVQGPPGLASFHCRETPLETPAQYDFDLMGRDIILTTALQRHGVLVSTVSRIYANAQLSDADVEYFAERAPKALAEAKQQIDDIYS